MAPSPDDLAPEPAGAPDPNVDTVVDDEWPVPDLYDVQPGDEAQATEEAEPAHGTRRFPPQVGRAPVVLALALLAVLAAAILAGAYAGRDDPSPAAATKRGSSLPAATASSTRTTETTPSAAPPLPDLVGGTYASARTTIEARGLRARARFEHSDRPQGEVVRQSPAAGEEAQPGATVVLTVSSGPDRVTVPQLEGLSARAASRLVRRGELQLELRVVHSDQPEGTVLAQAPKAGVALDPGATVTLHVSAGPAVESVDVPDLQGLSVDAARARLRALGLRSAVTRVASSEPEDTVIGQMPAAATKLRAGGTVRLRASSGPATAAVPDVIGLDEASARGRLRALGFRVEAVDEPTSDPDQDGLVVAQDPRGGTDADEGATITLTVARFG